MQKGVTAKVNEADLLMWAVLTVKQEKSSVEERTWGEGAGRGTRHERPPGLGLWCCWDFGIKHVLHNPSVLSQIRKKMDLKCSFFLDELCCGSNRRLLTFNLLKNVSPDSRPYSSWNGEKLEGGHEDARGQSEVSLQNRRDPIKRAQPAAKLAALVSCCWRRLLLSEHHA